MAANKSSRNHDEITTNHDATVVKDGSSDGAQSHPNPRTLSPNNPKVKKGGPSGEVNPNPSPNRQTLTLAAYNAKQP